LLMIFPFVDCVRFILALAHLRVVDRCWHDQSYPWSGSA
jgi:hypothetical protein